jgi:hypothetical protein
MTGPIRHRRAPRPDNWGADALAARRTHQQDEP